MKRARSISRKTVQQWQNDFAAANTRLRQLNDVNARLEKRARDAETALQHAVVDAADWRAAFKLIMKLVK